MFPNILIFNKKCFGGQILKMYISTKIALLFTLLFISSITCNAQVYAYIRTDGAGMVYTVNTHNGRSKALERVNQMEGNWELLLETTREGYGSVFCVSNVKAGVNPRYFLSYGKDTAEEAIREARDEAQKYATQLNKNQNRHYFTPFIMYSWNNLNKYPLEQ